MTPVSFPIYAVVEVLTGRVVYVGPSEAKAAKELEPGTMYGEGQSRTAALLNARQKIARVRAVRERK